MLLVQNESRSTCLQPYFWVNIGQQPEDLGGAVSADLIHDLRYAAFEILRADKGGQVGWFMAKFCYNPARVIHNDRNIFYYNDQALQATVAGRLHAASAALAAIFRVAAASVDAHLRPRGIWQDDIGH